MSEPKLISPLLDNFIMGDPISDHHGVRCCPAMAKNSDDKYIVKIISIPASQSKVEALLLTGAYADTAACEAYFKDLVRETVTEIEIQQKLAAMEGFVACDDYQVVPMENGTGFDVYMLTKYRRSFERQSKKAPLSQLDALNLALDMCAALNACRRNGYLYADLKPSNIYIADNNEYRIGDLGFINLASMKYASLSDQFISEYTAPEVKDPFSPLNDKLDIYALGAVLYQIYSGGKLPVAGEDGIVDAPEYADTEITQILLKALDPNPANRWEDPAQMGQAFVSYMQRNGASQDPIVPPSIVIIPESQEAEPVETVEDILDGVDLGDEESSLDAYSEDTEGNLTFIGQEESVLNTVAEEAQDFEDADAILDQVDSLANHKIPDPVVVPGPIDVPVPPMQEPPAEEQAEASAEESQPENEDAVPDFTLSDPLYGINLDDYEEVQPAEDEPEDSVIVYEEEYTEPKPKKKWPAFLILGILAFLLIGGAVGFYLLYYLQPIEDLKVTGAKDYLTVSVSTDVEEELLSVVCENSYGKSVTVPVVNSQAQFSGLLADTEYVVRVQIAGLHKLTGKTSANYFTPDKTTISNLTALTGTTAGTTIISFVLDGPDSPSWQLFYSTAGEDEQVITFSGNSVTLEGLVVGAEYDIRIVPETELYLSGETQLSFVASNVVLAEDLAIVSLKDNYLVASWKIPENEFVDGWRITCTGGDGYTKTITTNNPIVTFSELDHTKGYTVEVTAVGQSVSQKVSVGENAITVSNIEIDLSTVGQIKLIWDSTRLPVNGWTVTYTIEGQNISFDVSSDENHATIIPALPESHYSFQIKANDNSPVVHAPAECTTASAKNFKQEFGGYSVSRTNLSFGMCKTPNKENWNHNDVPNSAYTQVFKSGDKASFVIFLNRVYGISYEMIYTTFAFYDSEGSLVDVAVSAAAWSDMWYKNYCEMDIPVMPQDPGAYTVKIYFNGQYVTTQSFSITES